MIKDKLVIIPFGLSWNWPADYEKQTALTLAKKNEVIAFLFGEGLSLKNYLKFALKRQKKKLLERSGRNLFKFRPLYLLPFQRFKIIQKINFFLNVWQLKIWLYLRKEWRDKKKLLWLFTHQFSLEPSRFGRDFFPLYDCVDWTTSLDEQEAKEKKRQERKIISQVKIVFANSYTLYNLKKRSHQKVYLVPQGFNLTLFLKKSKYLVPKDLEKIPSPRIGFIGNINYRLDFDLIKDLAFFCPSYSFIFIGHLATDVKQDKIVYTQKKLESITKIKNIYFLGRKTKDKIPSYIRFLDFGFIPYNVEQEFNRLCYPMKAFEYFYMEKPVISTPIEELKRLKPYVIIVKNAAQAKKAIEKILKSGWPKNYKKEQRKLAIANSCEAKIEKISQILKKEFPQEF